MKKRILTLLLLTLLLGACTASPEFGPEMAETFVDEGAIIQEVTFHSNGFKIVGDLRRPAEGEMHPAVIMLHGDGPATRDGNVPFEPTIQRFLRNGYAVFSWDKPGSGESTGELDGEYELSQRAAILADGIEILKEHPSIDSTRIGLWGLSQAGWVMPLALELTDEVAFMIVVSGGAEDSIEQMAFQIGQKIPGNGGTAEQAAHFERYFAPSLKATDYPDYLAAMEKVLEIPDVERVAGLTLEIAAEDDWRPWPRDIDAFFDPMRIVEHTTIPVLAYFGEWDKLIDPVQGAEAYEMALRKAGNQDYQIVTIPRMGHVFTAASEYLETMEAWLQHLSLGDQI